MATDLNLQVAGIQDDYKYGFHDSEEHYAFKSGRGLTREVVCQISEMKGEPQWMRDLRLQSLAVYERARVELREGLRLGHLVRRGVPPRAHRTQRLTAMFQGLALGWSRHSTNLGAA